MSSKNSPSSIVCMRIRHWSIYHINRRYFVWTYFYNHCEPSNHPFSRYQIMFYTLSYLQSNIVICRDFCRCWTFFDKNDLPFLPCQHCNTSRTRSISKNSRYCIGFVSSNLLVSTPSTKSLETSNKNYLFQALRVSSCMNTLSRTESVIFFSPTDVFRTAQTVAETPTITALTVSSDSKLINFITVSSIPGKAFLGSYR